MTKDEVVRFMLKELEKEAGLRQLLSNFRAAGLDFHVKTNDAGIVGGLLLTIDGKTYESSELSERLSWSKITKNHGFDPKLENKRIFKEFGLAGRRAVMKGKSENIEVRSDKNENASSLADRLTEADLGEHPSRVLFKKAVESQFGGGSVGKLYIDASPTGTGKSWSITEELIAQIKNGIGKKIIVLAPEKRHMTPIFERIRNKLPNSNAFIAKSKGEVLAEADFPDGCLFQNSKSTDSVDLGKKVEQLRTQYKKRNKEEDIELRIKIENELGGLWNKVKSNCESLIKKTDKKHADPCMRCGICFPGSKFMGEKENAVAIMTYDKIYYGLDSLEWTGQKSVSFFKYSPFVSNDSKGMKSFKNCLFVCEEYSHGHKRLVGVIEEKAVSFSVFGALENTVRSYSDAYRKKMLVISHDNEEFFSKYEKRAIEKTDAVMTGMAGFWMGDKNLFPYLNERACVIFSPKMGVETKTFSASMSYAYTSLFPTTEWGIKALDKKKSDLFDGNEHAFSLMEFKNSHEMKKAGYASLRFTVDMANAKILEKVGLSIKLLSEAEMDSSVSSRTKAYSEEMLREVYGADEQGEAITQYIRQSARGRSGMRISSSLGGRASMGLSDSFYELGYKMLMATAQDGSADIRIRMVDKSPELMMSQLLNAKNSLFLSSASVMLDSPITNVDLDWIEKKHPGERADRAAMGKLLSIKESMRRIPEIVWGDECSKQSSLVEFENKSDEEAMRAALDAFVRSLEDHPNEDRYALVFCNSKADCLKAQKAVKSIHETGALRMELETNVFDASDFKNGNADKVKEKIAKHFASKARTAKAFVIFAPYNSLATGVNLHVSIGRDELFGESRVWDYCDKSEKLRVRGKTANLEADVSDIVLLEPQTHVVNEENYLRVAHQLLAIGDLDWIEVGVGAITKGWEPWKSMTSLLKSTKHFATAQFDSTMQALGRMERTLNSSKQPRIFVNKRFVNSLSALGDDELRGTMLTKSMKALVNSAKERIKKIERAIRLDELEFSFMGERRKCSSGEFLKFLAIRVRGDGSKEVRKLWRELRKYLTENQVLRHNEAHPSGTADLISELKKWDLKLEDFYFSLPMELLRARKNLKTGYVRYVRDGNVFSFHSDGESSEGFLASYGNWKSSCGDKSIMALRPDLLREVAKATEFEWECRNMMEDYGKRKTFGDSVEEHLFERADLFVEECGLAVDAKAWSAKTMSSAANESVIEELLEKASYKLSAMKDEANGSWYPTRYVYAMKTWWPSIAEKYGEVAVFFKKDGIQCDIDDEWEAAFVHMASHEAIVEVMNGLHKEISDEN